MRAYVCARAPHVIILCVVVSVIYCEMLECCCMHLQYSSFLLPSSPIPPSFVVDAQCQDFVVVVHNVHRCDLVICLRGIALYK